MMYSALVLAVGITAIPYFMRLWSNKTI